MKDTTKKLQKLVKNRKTQIVVIKKGSVRYPSKSSSSENSYYGDSYN